MVLVSTLAYCKLPSTHRRCGLSSSEPLTALPLTQSPNLSKASGPVVCTPTPCCHHLLPSLSCSHSALLLLLQHGGVILSCLPHLKFHPQLHTNHCSNISTSEVFPSQTTQKTSNSFSSAPSRSVSLTLLYFPITFCSLSHFCSGCVYIHSFSFIMLSKKCFFSSVSPY